MTAFLLQLRNLPNNEFFKDLELSELYKEKGSTSLNQVTKKYNKQQKEAKEKFHSSSDVWRYTIGFFSICSAVAFFLLYKYKEKNLAIGFGVLAGVLLFVCCSNISKYVQVTDLDIGIAKNIQNPWDKQWRW